MIQERISELKEREEKKSSLKHRNKRINRKKNTQDKGYIVKSSNIKIIGVPEERETGHIQFLKR